MVELCWDVVLLLRKHSLNQGDKLSVCTDLVVVDIEKLEKVLVIQGLPMGFGEVPDSQQVVEPVAWADFEPVVEVGQAALILK